MERRSFLKGMFGAGLVVAAPAIVRASSLMPLFVPKQGLVLAVSNDGTHATSARNAFRNLGGDYDGDVVTVYDLETNDIGRYYIQQNPSSIGYPYAGSSEHHDHRLITIRNKSKTISIETSGRKLILPTIRRVGINHA
jgi:hypothetical protein